MAIIYDTLIVLYLYLGSLYNFDKKIAQISITGFRLNVFYGWNLRRLVLAVTTCAAEEVA